jgi:hypothetical protein
VNASKNRESQNCKTCFTAEPQRKPRFRREKNTFQTGTRRFYPGNNSPKSVKPAGLQIFTGKTIQPVDMSLFLKNPPLVQLLTTNYQLLINFAFS